MGLVGGGPTVSSTRWRPQARRRLRDSRIPEDPRTTFWAGDTGPAISLLLYLTIRGGGGATAAAMADDVVAAVAATAAVTIIEGERARR